MKDLNLYILFPHIFFAISVLLSVFIEMYSKNSAKILPGFSFVIFGISALLMQNLIDRKILIFNSSFEVGGISALLSSLFLTIGALVSLSSEKYLKKYEANYGEFYLLLQNSILGMIVLVSARDLFSLFLGLELMSISFYILAGFNRKRLTSNEAAMKYFLLGSFATGFIVYGIAFIYGSSGTMNLITLKANIANFIDKPLFLAGMLFLIIGFSFKASLVPFHMWAPDVYQGSPTLSSAFMSTIGKAAAFGILIVISLSEFSGKSLSLLQNFFYVASVLSMFFGAFTAIVQNNIKRILAYSSIAHAGYIAIGLTAITVEAKSAAIFYLIAYTFMSFGAFILASIIEGKNESRLEIDNYIGLGKKYPYLAGILSLFMFALAGIPPLAGFFGKYYVFLTAIENGFIWLAILGILSSAIGVYFYLKIVVYMYFKSGEFEEEIETDKNSILVATLSALIVIIIGAFPNLMLSIIQKALS